MTVPTGAVVCCSRRLFSSSLRHGLWSWPGNGQPGRPPPVFTLASLLRDCYLVSHAPSSSAYFIYAGALETCLPHLAGDVPSIPYTVLRLHDAGVSPSLRLLRQQGLASSAWSRTRLCVLLCLSVTTFCASKQTCVVTLPL